MRFCIQLDTDQVSAACAAGTPLHFQTEQSVYSENRAYALWKRAAGSEGEKQDAWYFLPESFAGLQTGTWNGLPVSVQGNLDPKRLEPVDFALENRQCVLLNTTIIDEKWLRPLMRPLLHPSDRVCILAMSYFNDTRNAAEWDMQYGPARGIWYRAHQDVFYFYGLKKEQICWVNPFCDSPAQIKDKILDSNVLLLPGGAPDLFMQRIRKSGLKKTLQNYRGLVIGCSAGSMIQLGPYHISEDEDYPAFQWETGLGYLPDFDIEAHYHHTRHQDGCIEKAMARYHLPVYAIGEQGGLYVDHEGRVTMHGDVTMFEESE